MRETHKEYRAAAFLWGRCCYNSSLSKTPANWSSHSQIGCSCNQSDLNDRPFIGHVPSNALQGSPVYWDSNSRTSGKLPCSRHPGEVVAVESSAPSDAAGFAGFVR